MIDLLLIIHYIGLSIGAGTSVYLAALGVYASRTGEPATVKAIMLGGGGMLANVGLIGYLMLVVSGVLLIWVTGMGPALGWTFHAKMLFVLGIGIMIFYLRSLNKKARQEEGMVTLAKMKKMGPLVMTMALLTIIFAVMTFH